MEEILRNFWLYIYILLFSLILAPQLSVAESNGPPFQCPEPNFMNQSGDLYGSCNDILNGERVFLPIDDLAISQIYDNSGTFNTNVFFLNTENNTIFSQSSTQIASSGPRASGFQSLDFGRFVKQGIFNTEPNAQQGVAIVPNKNVGLTTFCPKAGFGERLVMSFFRSGGLVDCDFIPTALPFGAADNAGMVWSTIVADFNKDGLDDLFVNYLPGGGYRILSFESVDSTDFTRKMTASAEGTGLFLVDATAGDFDGDGQLEVAGVQNNDGTVQLVVLELAYDANGHVTGFMPPILIDNSQINMNFGIEPGKTIGITSGDFDPTDPFVDELVVAATPNTELSEVAATMVAFELNLSASCSSGTLCSSADTCTCINNLTQSRVNVLTPGIGITRPSTPIRLKTKKILNAPDMAVLGINSPITLPDSDVTFFNISVLDFSGENGALDFNLISTQTTLNPSLNGFACLHDVTIGNFDPDGDQNPHLMVAALFANSDFQECTNILVDGIADTGKNPRVEFFEIGETLLTQTLVVELDGFTDGQALPLVDSVTSYMNLEAGDLQGRSFLLGNPTKVIVNNHIQPAVVIKSPPMHVTTLPPPAGSDNNVNSSDNTVIGNIITAFPDLFNAEFGTSTTTGQTFIQNGTTGYTISTQEGAEGSVAYRVPDEKSDASAKFSDTAEQVHQNSVSNKYNQYIELMQGQMLGQRFDDEMMSVHNRQNIWSYPILDPNGVGCTRCGAANRCPETSGCKVGEAPVIVNISAPDMITVAVGSTVNLEWYQPPEVPGNVLTYPWTFAQLEQQFAGFLPLSDATPEIEIIGTSDSPVRVTAVGNSGTTPYDSSVGHSFDTSLSVSASTDIFPGFGVDANADFQYNRSNSFSTLYESESMGSLADGFTINKNSVPNASAVQYPFRYYIFGQSPVPGTVQGQIFAKRGFPVTGPLFLGFEANPASSSEQSPAGPWWFDTYQNNNPDIAFNLPAQWDWITDEGESDNPRQFRFLKNSDTSGLFYFMKSFFILPLEGNNTSCPSNVPGSGAFDFGPQQTIFADGEDVLLCLRVYNLSLSDFPAGSQPKIRIYRREWDHNTGNFDLGAGSIFVDEINLDQIPKAGAVSFGDQNSSDAPNWVYGGTVFDTTGVSSDGDTYWKFWAVTWIENSDGTLVEELSDLGLNSIPPVNTNVHTGVSTESFSNNVGLYNQVFKITKDGPNKEDPLPGDEETPEPTPQPPLDSGPISLNAIGVGDPIFIQSLNPNPQNVVPGDRSQLDLIVNNFNVVPHNVLLLYYDNDPELGGKLFDMEFLPKVPAQDTFRVKNSFLPRSCGTHSLFVKMFADDGSSDMAVTTVTRECTQLSISEAFYTPSTRQLDVKGTALGILRGSDIKLFGSNNFQSTLSVLSEEDLGINGGIRTFSFTITDLSVGEIPCLARVVAGQVVDQRRILGAPEKCVIDPENPPPPSPSPAPPTPTPIPTPVPEPTPIPGDGPFDPDDENVVDVDGVLIVSPEGTMLEDASRVLPECPDELNGEQLDYPLDFFTFEVNNIGPGESVQVNIILPEGTENVDSYFKFGPTPDNPEPHCYDFAFDGTTGAQILSNGEILITFVDGLRGDSDLSVNGIITDPGGPVIREFENPQIGVGDCSLARSSQTPSALISLMIPLIAGLFAGARILRRRKW